LELNELHALWRKVYEAEPFTKNRILLEKRLAYRLQEIEFERHNKALIQSNKARIQALIDNNILTKKSTNKAYTTPSAGTMLTRIYQGKEHQVLITHDGQFTFEGKLYNNLSTIACEITGTRWSGPVFFNLRKTTRNKTKKPSTSRNIH
jgi:hypothetical protein